MKPLKALLHILFVISLVLLVWQGGFVEALLIEYSHLSSVQLLLVTCLLYALLLAIPFIPGMEIGLLIMATFGKPGIIGAWLATVIGLNLAYWLGKRLAHLKQIRNLRARMIRYSRAQSKQSNLPARIYNTASRHPYLLLAFLFNVPGNAVFGGGGGLALISGAGAQLQWRKFLLVTLTVTAVLPALIWLGIIALN